MIAPDPRKAKQGCVSSCNSRTTLIEPWDWRAEKEGPAVLRESTQRKLGEEAYRLGLQIVFVRERLAMSVLAVICPRV
jgi:hypothetical protein